MENHLLEHAKAAGITPEEFARERERHYYDRNYTPKGIHEHFHWNGTMYSWNDLHSMVTYPPNTGFQLPPEPEIHGVHNHHVHEPHVMNMIQEHAGGLKLLPTPDSVQSLHSHLVHHLRDWDEHEDPKEYLDHDYSPVFIDGEDPRELKNSKATKDYYEEMHKNFHDHGEPFDSGKGDSVIHGVHARHMHPDQEDVLP